LKARNKLDVFKVLYLIQQGARTVKELAEKFNCSPRTIQGYIKDLITLGNPIQTVKKGKDSYYKWDGEESEHLIVKNMEGFE
jgi:predicted DNA-binding transcriptional regulator YafY